MIRGWIFLVTGLIVLLVLFIPHHRGMAEERYIVKSGDTLHDISRYFGLTIEALKKSNGLKGDAIWPKQVLLIPIQEGKQLVEKGKGLSSEKGSYVVRKGDSLYSISKRIGFPVEEIKKMNQLHSTNLKIGQSLILLKTKARAEDENEELGDPEELEEPLKEGEGEKGEASEPLGKWISLEERNIFVRVVKTFLGVPYRMGGSTLKGIDCSAFVKKIYEIFDIFLPRTAREQFGLGKNVEKEQLEEGDLIFFKTRRGNNPHVGIYIGNNEFIHASHRSKEVKLDNLNIPYFNKRFLKGVRIKELGEES